MAEELERLAYDVHRDVSSGEERGGARRRLTEQFSDADHRRQLAGELRFPHDLAPDRNEIVAAVAVHAECDDPSVGEPACRHRGERSLSHPPLSVDDGVLATLRN